MFKLENLGTELISFESIELDIEPNSTNIISSIEMIEILDSEKSLLDKINVYYIDNDSNEIKISSDQIKEYLFSLLSYAPKTHTHIKTDINDFEHNHNDLYYQKFEVDNLITNNIIPQIINSVNTYNDLLTANEGDIYIVKNNYIDKTNAIKYIINDKTFVYLPFDNNYNSTNDYIINISGTLNYEEGKFNQSALFNPNTYLYFTNNNSLDFINGVSIGCWINIPDTENNKQVTLFDYTRDKEGIKIYVYNNQIFVAINSNLYFTKSIILNNEWEHIGIVISNEINIYYNGLKVLSYPIEYTINNITNYIYINKPGATFKLDDYFITKEKLTDLDFIQLITNSDNLTIYKKGIYKFINNNWEYITDYDLLNNHNSLTGLNTGEFVHLTKNEHQELTKFNTTNLHNHDNRYYTKEEVNNISTNHNHNDLYYTKIELNNGSLDDRYYIKGEVDSKINNLTFNSISINDKYTDITSQELEQLTNGSNADNLHKHESLESLTLTKLLNKDNQISISTKPLYLNTSNQSAPLQLNNFNTMPTSPLNGQILLYNNTLYIYNETIKYWVGQQTISQTFTFPGKLTTNSYTYLGNILTSSIYGLYLENQYLISKITINALNQGQFKIHIKNHGETVYSEVIDQENKEINTNIILPLKSLINVYLENLDTQYKKNIIIIIFIQPIAI